MYQNEAGRARSAVTECNLIITSVLFGASKTNRGINASFFFCNIPVGSMTLDYLSVFGHIVSMTTCACVLQHFIFMTISTFGPLTCSIITTTRKFFTILSSVILFQHPITLLQWFGTTLVFAGLMLDTIFGKERLVIPVVHKTAGVTNCL